MLVVSFAVVLLGVAAFQLKHSNDVLKSRNTRLQSLTQQLEIVNKQKATTDQQLKDKAKAEQQLQDQINSLNTQLQAKLERQSIIARAAALATATQTAYAASLSYGNDYAWGNCTYFVASVVKVPTNLGNANTWAYYASQDGFSVGNIPAPGLVAQTSAGYLGHVALVTAVSGGQVQVEEMNVNGLGVVDYRWVNTGDFVYINFN